MKVLGYGVASDVLATGTWLALDDLTVVIGANDAGKTTVLTLAHDALALLQGSARASRWNLGVELFSLNVELEPAAMDEMLLRACVAVAEEGYTMTLRWPNREVVLDPHLGLPGVKAIMSFISTVDDPRETWLRFVRAAADLSARRWDPLFEALLTSSVVHLRATNRSGGAEADGWAPMWCLPTPSRLAPGVLDLVVELGLSIDDIADAPIALLPAHMRLLADEGMPQPVWVPRGDDSIAEELERTVTSLLESLNNCIGDHEPELSVPELPVEGELVGRIWQSLAAMTHSQLPGFVTDRYYVAAHQHSTADWRLEATSRVTDRTFPIAHLAQGHRLWVQLALFDALAVAESAAVGLAHGWEAQDADMDERILALLWHLGPGWDQRDRVGVAAALQAVALRWSAAQALVRRSEHDSFALPSVERLARVYFIDEPEQHLHPTLQRRAARWLRDWSRERGVQCLLATHAPAFMALGDGVRYARVSRDAQDRVKLESVDPRTIAASSEIAAELGLDRGELFGLYSVVLFVEGATDEAVLDHLVPDRLREAGILVCPLHGVSGVRAVPVAQMLFRMLRVPFAVLIDNDPEATTRSLWKLSTEELRRLSAKRGSEEIVHVARMLAEARNADVEVQPFSITTKDILGLLDVEAVAAAVLAAGGSPPQTWPGYGSATEAHAAERGHLNFDRFIAERYGVTKDPPLFAAAAAGTRRSQGVPGELSELLDDLERLSLGVL